MNGFLIADKPTGMTSSNLVVFVRHRLPKGTAVGHGGTLDPEAAGVLPICVGKATRLFDYIIDKQKTYIAQVQLGVVTDTQDATGKVVGTNDVRVTEEEFKAVLPHYVGDIRQIPPMYSAIKRDGKRMYRLARKGEVVELEPRPCRVDAVEFMEKTGENRYRICVKCGKGVYIRTICHDIGQELGCGAHMVTLNRVQAGVFTLENAHTKEEIQKLADEGRLEEALLPPDAPLGHLPMVTVRGAEAAHAVKNGNPLKKRWMDSPAPQKCEALRVYLEDKFVGIGCVEEDGTVRFRAMLME